jgi:hypothetical protein
MNHPRFFCWKRTRILLTVIGLGICTVIWASIAFAASLDSLRTHTSPILRRYIRWRRSPADAPIDVEVVEHNLRRCECRQLTAATHEQFTCRCRNNCPAFVDPEYLTAAAGQNLCSPYETTGYKCYAECTDEKSAEVKWFATPCGDDAAQEKCDPLLKMSRAQLKAKHQSEDPLDGFKSITAPALNGAPEQFWINYGATVSASSAPLMRYWAPNCVFIPQADTMVISWLTNSTAFSAHGMPQDDSPSTVYYGITPGIYSESAKGTSTAYTYGVYTSGRIHHVKLTGLAPRQVYYYHVGSPGTAGESSFTSNPGSASRRSFPYSLALLGDVGLSIDGALSISAQITVLLTR